MPSRDPITQAGGSARHLQQIIEKMTGHKINVRPVVLFPKWWVNEPKNNPHAWFLKDTRFFPSLKNETPKLSPENSRLYTDMLETHLTADR